MPPAAPCGACRPFWWRRRGPFSSNGTCPPVLFGAFFAPPPRAAAAAALFMWDASYLVYVGAGGFLAAGVSLAPEARDFTRLVCFSKLPMNFVAPPPPPPDNPPPPH